MLIYGIDPGFTGAIALYWPETGKLEVHDMPVMKNPKACAACKLPVKFVQPASWKKHFGLNRDKGLSRSLATQRFPEYAKLFARAKDDGRAEAALLALFGQETLA